MCMKSFLFKLYLQMICVFMYGYTVFVLWLLNMSPSISTNMKTLKCWLPVASHNWKCERISVCSNSKVIFVLMEKTFVFLWYVDASLFS